MPLPIIDEETVLDSFCTTNNGSRLLGQNTFYGASSDDNTSTFSHSTNSTASNLPGPGRILGIFYSLTGKHLEKALSNFAHKAGFGPEAIYQQISTLYLEDWITDGKKASKLQKLCFRLFKQTKSIADSTRFMAIVRWRDILRDQHDIYVLIFCRQQKRTVKHTSALLRVIEERQSTLNAISDFQDAVLSETSLLINCHSAGLNVITLNRARILVVGGKFQVDWTGVIDIHREEIEKWDFSFQYLLESQSDPALSEISRWYIDFWSSQLVEGTPHAHIVLQYCRSLQNILGMVNLSQISCWDALQTLCKEVYMHVLRRFNSDALLLDDGAHISSTLNDLTRLHDLVFSPKLGSVPNLACLTMLGSIDLISSDVKEKIRDCLKDLKDGEESPKKTVTETMFLRSCNKLLRRALSELDNADCYNMLSNATSFNDGTSRWAILQLGDILQSLPEVYMLLITLGGDEVRDSVESLHKSLKVSNNSTNGLERYLGILMDLRSLLACHAAGLWLASEDLSYVRPSEVNEFITRTAPFDNKNFREARELFVLYLVDNVTFNPLIFYLKYCISWIWCANYNWYYKHFFLLCSIVQGALLTGRCASPQENQRVMEELCRSMQSSIFERLHSSSTVDDNGSNVMGLGDAMVSAYTNLTESRQAFEDDAEFYLSQLCNKCFKIISKTESTWSKRCTIIELSDFFRHRNVFGWFLSICGPGAEESISRILEEIEDSRIFDRVERPAYKRIFSNIKTHKLGVELLAPRHEKLHFEGTGLTKHLSTTSAELPLTPEQRERWTNAFKTLAVILRSSDLDLIDIPLFYFANCPLPYEADPMLDTALALDNCVNFLFVFTEGRLFGLANKEDLSRAVSHIYTCLTKRVEFVQESCKELGPDEYPTFYGTPFDIPEVVEALNNLEKLSKEEIRFRRIRTVAYPNY